MRTERLDLIRRLVANVKERIGQGQADAAELKAAEDLLREAEQK